MAATKRITNARKLGFEDPDRQSPLHDEIVQWLASHQQTVADAWIEWPWPNAAYWMEANIQENLKAMEERKQTALTRIRQELHDAEVRRRERRQETTAKEAAWAADYQSRLEALIAELEAWVGHMTFPQVRLSMVRGGAWERPIKHRSGSSVVGFVDYCITVAAPPKLYLQDEKGFETMYGFDGSLSLHGLEERLRKGALPRWNAYDTSVELCIEVKASIGQLSEVLRQLQFYKVYECGPWAVCSPDCQFASTLLSQGFAFIPYTPASEPRVYRPGVAFEDPTG